MKLKSLGWYLAHALDFRFKLNNADQRSSKFIAAIDCILNQNSRDFGAANYPAMNKAVLQLCMKYDVGILQIPCPEMIFLGLMRKRLQGESIRDVLDTEAGRKCCRNLSINIADRIQDYLENKTRILAVLGGNPESPGCAIHFESSDKDKKSLAIQSGVFMKEFHKELCKRSIEVPFRGIRDYDSELIKTDLEWLEQVFAS